MRSFFDSGTVALYTVKLDGSDLRQITPSEMGRLLDSTGSWSPQGNEILFSARPSEGQRNAVFVVHTDGSGLQQIPIAGCGTTSGCREPVWSPDGKKIAFTMFVAQTGLSDLYTVNLATVVDKYVGETEKNLERIFTEAAGVNGVLLFDEADAIFGKRSEVRDAHDRYANIESAYLLQRMETFDGIAVLATNLRANLDEAFTRRLDVIVDFPLPDVELRQRLWDRCLGTRLPRASDVDLGFLAEAFELAGGHIRSAAVTGAYLAAEAGRPVGMADLVGAVAREYRKLGRLCLDREFGPYLALVTDG